MPTATNDHAYVYFGQRRGGNHYYALDVTNRSSPRLMWSLSGGPSGSPNFYELGQSWSEPVHHRVRVRSGNKLVPKDVLVFAGGYDPQQDTQGNVDYSLMKVDEGDLANRTDPQAVTPLVNSGWYIELKDPVAGTYEGEKALAESVTFGGQVIFTTFTPVRNASAASCAPSQGVGKLYVVDLLDTSPTQDFDQIDGVKNYGPTDRYYTLKRAGPTQRLEALGRTETRR